MSYFHDLRQALVTEAAAANAAAGRPQPSRRRQRTRSARRTTLIAGATALAMTSTAAGVAASRYLDPQPDGITITSRPQVIASGTDARVGRWKAIAYSSDVGDCLDVKVQRFVDDAPGGSGSCGGQSGAVTFGGLHRDGNGSLAPFTGVFGRISDATRRVIIRSPQGQILDVIGPTDRGFYFATVPGRYDELTAEGG